jgi:hypothetical protein
MGVDLRRLHARMTHEFLDGADISAAFEHVGREAVAERVAGGRFFDACGANGTLYLALN